MLKRLREHLKSLATDSRDPYDSIIRRLAGPRDASCFGRSLRVMILAMPDLLAQLEAWAAESGLPARHRLMRGFALAYLNHPENLLPTRTLGLFGYTDEAYLIARVYYLTMRDPDWSGQRYHVDDEELARAVPEWLELARRLLPADTARIDRLIEDVSHGREDAIVTALSRSSKRSGTVVRLAAQSH